MVPVSIVVPVGPHAADKQYLNDCLLSVMIQSQTPDEIIIVDDMAGLAGQLWDNRICPMRVWESPWRLGVAHAFNVGVSLARNQFVVLLGADDKLLPGAVEMGIRAAGENGYRDGYYFFGVEYSDGRRPQTEPCGAAMVTKGLWKETGGFPVESSSGASDAALVSILMIHRPDAIIPIDDARPHYWYRVHDQSDTSRLGPWQGVILETRNVATQLWEKPEWGRYE